MRAIRFKTINAALKWVNKNGYSDFRLRRVGDEYVLEVDIEQRVQTAVAPITAEVRG